MKNESVIHSWLNGETARNHNGSLHTDGVFLFSYNLMIGSREDNQNRVWDYTAPNFISKTTSKHVGLAMREAGTFFLMEPYN